jgi:hypothetical protein
LSLNVALVEANDFEMMILADVVAVGHTMIEGARDMLVVQITLKAIIRNIFLFFADTFGIYNYTQLIRYCSHDTTEMVIELTGNDTGCLTEGWEIVTHLTDKPEA